LRQLIVSNSERDYRLCVLNRFKLGLFFLRRAARSRSLLRLHLGPSSSLRISDSFARFRAHAAWFPSTSTQHWSANARWLRASCENRNSAIKSFSFFFECVDNLLSIHLAEQYSSAPFSVDDAVAVNEDLSEFFPELLVR
jgi:hypothetical protein